MINEKPWQEFVDAGLFWWVNRSLHLFGWALVREVDQDKNITMVYPARVDFRGFSEAAEEAGFKKLSSYMATNVSVLLEETKG